MRTAALLLVVMAGLSRGAIAAPGDVGAPIAVPSDPGARYQVLNVKWTGSTTVEVVTRREGKSGIRYSRRLVDCAGWRFRYVGEGDTLQAAMKPSSHQDPMGPLMDQSISTYVATHACRTR